MRKGIPSFLDSVRHTPPLCTRANCTGCASVREESDMSKIADNKGHAVNFLLKCYGLPACQNSFLHDNNKRMPFGFGFQECKIVSKSKKTNHCGLAFLLRLMIDCLISALSLPSWLMIACQNLMTFISLVLSTNNCMQSIPFLTL